MPVAGQVLRVEPPFVARADVRPGAALRVVEGDAHVVLVVVAQGAGLLDGGVLIHAHLVGGGSHRLFFKNVAIHEEALAGNSPGEGAVQLGIRVSGVVVRLVAVGAAVLQDIYVLVFLAGGEHVAHAAEAALADVGVGVVAVVVQHQHGQVAVDLGDGGTNPLGVAFPKVLVQ